MIQSRTERFTLLDDLLASRIDIWTPDAASPRTLRDADYLDGGDVVPGFRLALAELW
ncbi:MAG: hypothetical protein ACRDG4_01425 [Chloroflexota bacterium]